jgi:hypothetical protein
LVGAVRRVDRAVSGAEGIAIYLSTDRISGWNRGLHLTVPFEELGLLVNANKGSARSHKDKKIRQDKRGGQTGVHNGEGKKGSGVFFS